MVVKFQSFHLVNDEKLLRIEDPVPHPPHADDSSSGQTLAAARSFIPSPVALPPEWATGRAARLAGMVVAYSLSEVDSKGWQR
jgi:hypothetical protein